MSKYTTEVRYVCEVESGLVESHGFNSINTILDNSRTKIFNFPYPIFDEAYRPVLEKKILKHYYTREICAETVGLWKHYLDMRMNEIMPYYNKLYNSELLAFNPLYDVDLTRDHNKTGAVETEGQTTDSETSTNTRTDNLTRTDDLTDTVNNTRTDNLTETITNTRTDNLSKVTQDSGTQGESGSNVDKNTRWDVYSDTPQGALTNVSNDTYLTNARKIIDDGTGSTHSNTTTFGKKVTETDTGTVGDSGQKTNTGSQKNVGTEEHTGTVTNTGTQQNSGSKNATIGRTEDISTTEDYLEHVVGKTGGISYSKMLTEYRETFLNIDMMIIEELSDLFMGLW